MEFFVLIEAFFIGFTVAYLVRIDRKIK